nr:RNA polymerase beta' subunit [Mucuna pruriens]QOY46363.1 RNA polymerase beta' subunit [Mucuna pruriens]
MIDQYKHQQLRIGSVSPQQISAWAKKILPNGEIVGEVTKPYTFHYKTNKPEKDGLFCERIFGPIKSGICACGNYRVIRDKKDDPKFCEQCGVEFIDSRIRRYQMGYIKLACLVTHVWYLKRLPSYIANLLDKSLKELESLVYCDVSFDKNFYCTDSESETVIPFNLIGMPSISHVSWNEKHETQNYGCIEYSLIKRELVYGQFSNKKYEIININFKLYVPREKKNIFSCRISDSIFFRKNRNYVQISKYIVVAEVYTSHIGLRTSLQNHRGDVWTKKIEWNDTKTNKSLMNFGILFYLINLINPFLKIPHSKGSRLLKNFTFHFFSALIENWINNKENKKKRICQRNVDWYLLRTRVKSKPFSFRLEFFYRFSKSKPFVFFIWYNYLSRMKGNLHVRFSKGEILLDWILSQFFVCKTRSKKTHFLTITRFIRIRNPILETQHTTFFYYPRFSYISKSRNFKWSGCYPRTIGRSGFENSYGFFVDRMERIRGRGIPGQSKRMGRSKSWKKKEFFGSTHRISSAFSPNKYRTRMDGFMSFTSSSSRIETDYSNRWGLTNELSYSSTIYKSYLSESYSYRFINNKLIYSRRISNVSGEIGTRSRGYTSSSWNPRTTDEGRSQKGLQIIFSYNSGQRGKISRDSTWETGSLFGSFCHCCRSITFITLMWIAPRNSNRTFPDISNSWSNSKTFCFEHRNCKELNSGKRTDCMGNTSRSYAGTSRIAEWSADSASIRYTGIPTHFSRGACYLFASISLYGIQCRLSWGSNGCSCAFIFRSSSRSSFTYVFSYEPPVSGYWGSYFRTNSRYAYWTLHINERESSRYLFKYVYSTELRKFYKSKKCKNSRSLLLVYEKKRTLFLLFLCCNWSLSTKKNKLRLSFVAPVATRSTHYFVKRSSYRSSLCIFRYLSSNLSALSSSKKYKKRNSFYIHSNQCWSYFFLSRNRRSYTRFLPGLFIC